jgi:GAF domain
MAQRDLDAALQLLADRAQYITGATGAAIALRRDGRNDMLCRASTGTNAPELGALLSTEFGLSGESVRTRQLLRCDDAERDTRVNREVCREMGIASVLVMPVVNDDQVLGVFEIFSGKANAFGERDLSAVQRLSEMVETAVRMANAAETIPEHLSSRESSVAEAIHPEVFEGQFLSDLVIEEEKRHRQAQTQEVSNPETMAAAALESPIVETAPPVVDVTKASPQVHSAPSPITVPAPAKKPLFWSATEGVDDSAGTSGSTDDSHVPPVLRGLRKCEACGFPISAGRVLCVECEEKKWRGQLRPQAEVRKPTVVAVGSGGAAAAVAPSRVKPTIVPKPSAAPEPQKVPRVTPQKPGPEKAEASLPVAAPVPAEQVIPKESESTATPEFVLSAGIEPSRSWFSTYKWILLVVLVILGSAAAFVFFR